MSRRNRLIVCVPMLLAVAALRAHAASPIVPGVDRLPADAAAMRGSILLGELNCASCHTADRAASIDTKPAPDLRHVAARANPAWIERFIADPHAAKPGTTMPHLLAALTDDERAKAAKAITEYLRSLADKPFAPSAAAAEAAKRGFELFNRIGCAACHNPRDAAGKEQPIVGSVPLGDLAAKYGVESLAAFLLDPLAVRPGGRMPGMNLSQWEAHDVAAYLTQNAPEAKPLPPVDAARADEGRKHFASLGCAACHTIDGVNNEHKAPPLAGLSLDAGCLSKSGGDVRSTPRYGLSDDQRAAIAEALRSKPAEPTVEHRITRTLATFNCVACHQRGELGGIADSRQHQFHAENENLGEQGRVPPPLTGVGAKLERDWLRRVVTYGEKVRPYMPTRMPAYGKSVAEPLVELLDAADADLPAPPPLVEHANQKLENEHKGVGRNLVGDKGFNCVACHTFKGQKPPMMNALDLADATTRLRRSWFNAYSVSPQRFSPSTLMPSFFPNGESARKDVLDGDTHKQLDAIWQFLSDGNEAGTPSGLVNEPLILAVGDEAVMLRRQYAGVGKRGIGVGYPGRVNLVFDAEQMRLAEVWRGDFADASGVWRGQGSGNVRLLGEDHVKLPEGAAFAQLDDPATAWPEQPARERDIRFKGYTLDKLRRPTFEYRIGDIAVTDAFIDETGGDKPHFRRTLTFDAPHDAKLVMKLAEGQRITVREDGKHEADGLKLTVTGGGAGVTHKGEKTSELRLPIALKPGRTTLVIEYRW